MIEELKKILADRDAYDLVSAIRGDDYGFQYIEYVFTARIRYFLGVDGWTALVREEPYITKEDATNFRIEVETAVKENMRIEYFNYILLALEVLNRLQIMPELEVRRLRNLADRTQVYMVGKHPMSKGVMDKMLDEIIYKEVEEK